MSLSEIECKYLLYDIVMCHDMGYAVCFHFVGQTRFHLVLMNFIEFSSMEHVCITERKELAPIHMISFHCPFFIVPCLMVYDQ